MFPQHRNERSEQGDQETRVHEAGGGDDLARWILLSRWNHGGLSWDGGLVEGEENGAEEGGRLLVLVGLEVGTNTNDESRADGREKARLQERVR